MGAKTPIYPEWKTWLWRFVRSGVAGGAGAVAVIAIALRPDFSNWQEYGLAVLAAFISGFISAVGLMVRDLFASRSDMSDWVHKIPV